MRSVEEILAEQHERRMAAVRSLDGEKPATVTLSAETRARVLDMVGHHTYRYIGKRLGISISSVARVVRESKGKS